MASRSESMNDGINEPCQMECYIYATMIGVANAAHDHDSPVDPDLCEVIDQIEESLCEQGIYDGAMARIALNAYIEASQENVEHNS